MTPPDSRCARPRGPSHAAPPRLRADRQPQRVRIQLFTEHHSSMQCRIHGCDRSDHALRPRHIDQGASGRRHTNSVHSNLRNPRTPGMTEDHPTPADPRWVAGRSHARRRDRHAPAAGRAGQLRRRGSPTDLRRAGPSNTPGGGAQNEGARSHERFWGRPGYQLRAAASRTRRARFVGDVRSGGRLAPRGRSFRAPVARAWSAVRWRRSPGVERPYSRWCPIGRPRWSCPHWTGGPEFRLRLSAAP